MTFWVLFGLLCASLPVWFMMVSALYKCLASNHPEKYRLMGEPGLIKNNHPGSGLRLMKFIFTREDRPLNDSRVSRLTSFMLVLSICYLAVFLFLVIAVLLVSPGARGS